MNLISCIQLPVIILALSLSTLTAYSQDVKPEKEAKSKKPVKNTFENSLLVNSQTVEMLRKNTLLFTIQHRFGSIDKGFKSENNFDLFGILGVSNIRVGLNYALSDKLTVGLGATKNKYLYDFNWKYKILQQTVSNSIPVSVVYLGNTTINTLKGEDARFVNKLSYFHQLLIARKFNKKLSLQLGPCLSHFNLVDTIGGKDVRHLNFGIQFGGRFNVSPQGSILFEVHQPLTVADFGNGKQTLPTYGLGYEIATRGHVFQIFITNATSIINQFDMVENTNNMFQGEFQLGFNIARRWRF